MLVTSPIGARPREECRPWDICSVGGQPQISPLEFITEDRMGCGGGWFGNSGGSGQREGVCEMTHWQGHLPPSLTIQGDLQDPHSRRDLTPGSCPLTSTCVLPCVQVHTQAHKSNEDEKNRTGATRNSSSKGKGHPVLQITE